MLFYNKKESNNFLVEHKRVSIKKYEQKERNTHTRAHLNRKSHPALSALNYR